MNNIKTDFQRQIEDIMNYFASKGMLFSNEQDFQLAFALELINPKRTDSKTNKTADAFTDVKLEYLTFRNSEIDKNKKIKEYTDIVVDEKYAIELKYKTTDRYCNDEDGKGIVYKFKNNSVFVGKQGAVNQGVWDYLRDIDRLEHINNNKMPRIKGDGNDMRPKIQEKYAILMANEEKYWTGWGEKKNTNNKIKDNKKEEKPKKWKILYKIIAEETEKLSLEGKILDPDKSKDDPKLDYFHFVNIEGKYDINWEDYDLKDQLENYEELKKFRFRYLIVKVK